MHADWPAKVTLLGCKCARCWFVAIFSSLCTLRTEREGLTAIAAVCAAAVEVRFGLQHSSPSGGSLQILVFSLNQSSS